MTPRRSGETLMLIFGPREPHFERDGAASPRVAPQAGDFGFEEPCEIAHELYSWRFWPARAGGSLDERCIKVGCNLLMYRDGSFVK